MLLGRRNASAPTRAKAKADSSWLACGSRVGMTTKAGGGVPPPLYKQRQKQIPTGSLRSRVGMTMEFAWFLWEALWDSARDPSARW